VERLRPTIGPMRASFTIVATALAAAALAATTARAASGTSAADYSLAVTQICAGALLFDHPHHEGTRADALSIASDIRASTARRLASVNALTVPSQLTRLSDRWIASQRQLSAMFAHLWVRIYDTIDAARTPAQQAALPARLERLVHAPDSLKLAARRLELALHVPDCTGGG
jgi:hypothetical protein